MKENKRRLIPTNTKRNDCVQTPLMLAEKIVFHFKPEGTTLDPCKGDGNFIRAFKKFGIPNENILWCEILEGRDFFEWNGKVNWIITNPPYSKFRKFLQHSMKLADNIVFLTTINHFWLKARLRDMKENNFGIKEILLLETPKNFPQSGFQIGCVYVKRNYNGDIKLRFLRERSFWDRF